MQPPTAVSRNCGVWDLSELVLFETKFCLYLLTKVLKIRNFVKRRHVRGKTGLINFQTGNTGDKKAEKKLKMAAAVLGCPFILMTADKTTVGANSNQLGGMQAIKTGLGYKY